MPDSELDQLLAGVQVLPVLTVTSVEQAVHLCDALYQGGIKAVEITLRTPAGLAALAAVKHALPNLIVAAGTVTNAQQVAAVQAAGVDFAVSPASTQTLLQAVHAAGLPFIPGVATPSEAMAVAELGFDHQKLFPATAVGGLALIKSLAAPLPELRFCPTGGLHQENFMDYLRQANVFCVGGSWMVPGQALANGDWEAISVAAQGISEAIKAG